MPERIVEATAYGVVPDDDGDDAIALDRAITAASAGAIVRLPRGRLVCSRPLLIPHPRVHLRGAGSGSTTLAFTTPLRAALGERGPAWSFRGGLVWFTRHEPSARPADDGRHPLHRVLVLDDVDRELPLAAGATQVPLRTRHAEGIRPAAGPGSWIPVEVVFEGGTALADRILGAPGYEWSEVGWMDRGRWRFAIPNEARLAADRRGLELRKPLRLGSSGPGTSISIDALPSPLLGCGIEGVTLAMPEHAVALHLQDAGWNGIMMEEVGQGLIRDVHVVNADNGIILERCWNVTIEQVELRGQPNHHAVSYRASHDILMRRFRILSRSMHGLSAQDLSSGNVWCDGEMHGGTFDSHRGMPFQSVRTRIRLVDPTGLPGGDAVAGPFQGRGMVHWDIEVQTSGLKPRQIARAMPWIAQPAAMPHGVIAGIRGIGVHSATRAWAMPFLAPDQRALVINAAVLPPLPNIPPSSDPELP